MTGSLWFRLSLTTAVAAALAAPAFAQQSTGVEEVVVTAERRETKLQETPISISALTSATLEDAHITRVEDFAHMLPNVFIDDRNLRGQNIAIRGISADLNNPGLDQGVGLFVDGIYLGRATVGNANLYDLERIEVLRGPQGTLYGKNTIAGAINYITRKPSLDEFTAEGDFSYGNYGAFAGDAVVSTPLAHGLAASLGASFDQRDGLIKNLATGVKQDDRDGQSARFQLLGKPGENLEWIIRADVSRDRTHSGADEVVNNGQFNNTPFAQPAPTTRDVFQNRDTTQNRDSWGISAEVNWTTPIGTVTSLTGYRALKWFNLADNDYTALDLLASGITEKQSQVSEELRLASNIGQNFDYIVGAYYFHQHLNTDAQAIVGADLGVYPRAVNVNIFGLLDTDSYAAFVHGEYHFTDQWSLVAGLRYTQEDKSVDQAQIGDPFGLVAATQPFRLISRSENAASPMVSINYKATPDLFYYATFSQGYKSGGFNVFSITRTNNAEYQPENVDNYEIGVKSAFLDHRLQVDLSAFYMEYQDLQVNQLLLVNGLPQFQTSNAASARSAGFELQLDAKPTPETTINFTYGYDDATFLSYHNATTTGADYTGHALTRAPKNNASLAGEWVHPLTGGLEFFARAEVSYRSKIFFGVDNALSQGDLTLINARVGVQSSSGDWGVYLWSRNLGDVNYAIDKEAGAIVQGQVIEALAAPRTFGIQFRARY